MRRSKFLWDGTCHERLAIHNFDAKAHSCWLSLNFAADFADLFEIRGIQRPKRGEVSSAVIGNARTIFRYVGLDQVERRSEISFDPPPQRLSKNQALYALTLKPGEQTAIVVTVRCIHNDLRGSAQKRETSTDVFFGSLSRGAARAVRAANLGGSVTSSNELANRMLHRAGADLSMLVTETPQGPYPYAGTPGSPRRSAATG